MANCSCVRPACCDQHTPGYAMYPMPDALVSDGPAQTCVKPPQQFLLVGSGGAKKYVRMVASSW